MSPEIRKRLDELLGSVSTLVLATSGPGAAPLFFVADGLRLYWLSSPESRHSRALANGAAAVAVFAPAWDWRSIRGAQMSGRAAAVADGGERDRVIAEYRRRFGLGDEFDRVIADSTLYRFEPAWIRYLDNRLGFGFKAEFAGE